MNEFEKAFNEDVREKKALVPSARERKCGSKSKVCTVPSDFMTKYERRAGRPAPGNAPVPLRTGGGRGDHHQLQIRRTLYV